MRNSNLANLQLMTANVAASKQASEHQRVPCSAHLANGGRCTRKSEPGHRRCRYHGGKSTGPRTIEGKARVTLNLPRCRAAAQRALTPSPEVAS